MVSFKGIRKYLIYLSIAGWMFFIGILVGRGTAPITFDTKEFSKKLEKIVNVPDHKPEVNKKPELKFYENLDNSATQESVTPKNVTPADTPEKEAAKNPARDTSKEPVKELPKEPVKDTVKIVTKESIKKPAKIIKKESVRESLKEAQKEPVKEPVKKEVNPDTTAITTEVKNEKPSEAVTETTSSKGVYTIQIAAFKNSGEAAVQMAAMVEKGFAAYQEKAEKEGMTWYRVKIGPFETYTAAKEFKVRLDKAKIDSMIMKRESNEDIKE